MDLGLLLVVILIAVFVWRGPRTLPELGRMFGEGVRAVRREARRDPGHDRDSSLPPEQDGR
ncbi:MAG: twin-arginine translocase TatA/TatE family subunit [Candidatus Limnocylindrales bacterium]